MTKFKIGDLVKYTSGQFGSSPHNPLWGGTEGNVKGTIEEIVCDFSKWAHTDDKEYIYVQWDNGHSNSYASCDLALYLEGICPKCGEDYVIHNDDGTCAEKNP